MTGQAAETSTAVGLARTMSLFYAASFLIIGIYGPFFPVWLKAQGLTPALVGIILSLPMFMRIFASPLTAFFADRIGNPRLMVQAMTLLTVLGFLAPFLIGGAPGLCFLAAVNAVALPSIVPLGETVALSGVQRFGLDYGRMRMWGSIAFVALFPTYLRARRKSPFLCRETSSSNARLSPPRAREVEAVSNSLGPVITDDPT